ncbi:beta-alanyl-dopamine/carcinine hydrolase [Neocloeon triangulifer]|uniref:beta-alanyl-dopamine/carcinine hydrolase n=1 Tax=Neocloeon triangulifer TaxID=2078957 RepID=UPI00286EBE85|nr:beta-alanyl-dopamine/carcinine hydrolase [Neocloeon triangulifer]
MPNVEDIGRRRCIPIIHTRGTHYEVGFDVGRTFRGLIQNFVGISKPLNQVFIPLYNTEAGRRVYETTLKSVRSNFPQYVRELEGTAEGAQVPFYKLFLLHMDDILPNAIHGKGKNDGTGCSTIVCNQPGHEILGHTEDALPEVLNHIYLVSAHITPESPQGRWKVSEEKYTSLCYAGHLPGFTMGYNHHGLVFSVNVLNAAKLVPGKTPRHFLTRALLGAETFVDVQQILQDTGCGSGDAVSINLTFLNQEGDRMFHNAEVGPALGQTNQSNLNILNISPGESIFHCNKFLRLPVEEAEGLGVTSSNHRHDTHQQLSQANTKQGVIKVLGDQSDNKWPIYREGHGEDFVKTVAVGIFDVVEKTWELYTENPKISSPVVVLPLELKSNN